MIIEHEGSERVVLKIDSFASAFDIPCDAWNLLGFETSATKNSQMGASIKMN